MHAMSAIGIICCVIYFMDISRAFAKNCPADKENKWSYEERFSNGPSHWGDKYPDCKSNSQSPINIKPKELSKEKGELKLKLSDGYKTPVTKVKIENNGHTIVITPQDGVERSMEHEQKTYTLVQFHFHWGNNGGPGSEHKIDGKQEAMEAHFVHKNNEGQLAVVGVILEVARDDNAAMYNILYAMNSYLYKGQSFEGEIKINNPKKDEDPHRLGKIYLEDFVQDRLPFYNYNGSLTTPPCSENVQWLVCKKIKNVGFSQLRQLSALFSVKKGSADRSKCDLVNNYRPVQPLNGRKVYG